MQEFSVEFDIGKLMENFFTLRSFSTFGVVHTHHIQHATFDLPAVTVSTTATVTGITFPQAFPAGVVPTVIAQANNTGGDPGGVVTLVFFPINITNTGCDVRIWNSGTAGGSSALTNGGKLVAFDPTYNTSDY